MSPIPKWIYDLKTLQILDVNEAAIHHYGYSREEFMQMKIGDLSASGNRPKALCDDDSLHDNESVVDCGIVSHVRKDGSEIKAEVSGHRFDYNGTAGMMVVAIDVSKRESALQKIQENSAKL